MLRYAIRRILWAIPTLFAISIVAFLVTTLLPVPPEPALSVRLELLRADPDQLDLDDDDRREALSELPRFFNTKPRDLKTTVEECVDHIVRNDEQAPLAEHKLAHIGGAVLPVLLPTLDRLEPESRSRVAMAISSIADRMGVSDYRTHTPNAAATFWTQLWDDRAVEFTRPASRRVVKRLVDHPTDSHERDLLELDSYVLDDTMVALRETIDVAILERLTRVTQHLTGRGAIVSAANDNPRTVQRKVDEWQRWWLVHRTDYVVLDGYERIGATVLETRYGKWLLRAATGQFGDSLRDGEPISEKLRARAPTTITLTLIAIALSVLTAIPVGVITAWKRGKRIDLGLAAILFALYAVPTYLLAQGLQYFTANTGSRIAWSALVLTVASVATLSRYQRASMLDVLSADYVRTARAKGLSAARVLIVHALRNALLPVVTLAGLQLPALLGSAIVVEEVFELPGIGWETMRAVESHDTPWLFVTVLITALSTTFFLIATDVTYGVLDPRLRERMLRLGGV